MACGFVVAVGEVKWMTPTSSSRHGSSSVAGVVDYTDWPGFACW